MFYNKTQNKHIESELDDPIEFLKENGWSTDDELYQLGRIRDSLTMFRYDKATEQWVAKKDEEVQDIIEIMADISLNNFVDEFIGVEDVLPPPSGVFETIYFPPTSGVGDWAFANWELLTKKYGVEGYYKESFARGEIYVITDIPGHPFKGSVGTDHVGRNPDDKDVMIVERFLEQVRASEK